MVRGLWGKKSEKETSPPADMEELGGEEDVLDMFKSETVGAAVSGEESIPAESEEELPGESELLNVFKSEAAEAEESQGESGPPASPPADKEEPSGGDGLLDVFKAEKQDNLELRMLTDELEDVDIHDLLQECLDVASQLKRNR